MTTPKDAPRTIEDIGCGLCGQAPVLPTTLLCGDTFCTECLREAVLTDGTRSARSKCPECKEPFTATMQLRPNKALVWLQSDAPRAVPVPGTFEDIHAPYVLLATTQHDVAVVRRRIAVLEAHAREMERHVAFQAEAPDAAPDAAAPGTDIVAGYAAWRRRQAARVLSVGLPGGPPRDLYSVIMAADIPWAGMDREKDAGALAERLCALPLKAVAASGCIVVVGAPPSHVSRASDLIERWGFRPIGIIAQWMVPVKAAAAAAAAAATTTKTRASARRHMRYYLAGVSADGGAGAAAAGRFERQRGGGTLVDEVVSPPLDAKPSEFYDMLRVQFACYAHKLELFVSPQNVSRQSAPGWDTALGDFFARADGTLVCDLPAAQKPAPRLPTTSTSPSSPSSPSSQARTK